jgi:hypothetical protein
MIEELMTQILKHPFLFFSSFCFLPPGHHEHTRRCDPFFSPSVFFLQAITSTRVAVSLFGDSPPPPPLLKLLPADGHSLLPLVQRLAAARLLSEERVLFKRNLAQRTESTLDNTLDNTLVGQEPPPPPALITAPPPLLLPPLPPTHTFSRGRRPPPPLPRRFLSLVAASSL